MNVALVGFIILVVSLFIILIYLLNINKKTKINSSKSLQKNNVVIIDINSIQFPKNIEQMNITSLLNACKVIFISYNSLSYVNKLPSSLDKIEWHTWQVSILLVFLKNKNRFLISESNENIFHNTILQLNETQMNQELQRIYKKYLDNVNIYKNRDNLSRDVIWSARDVSIILYNIINQK